MTLVERDQASRTFLATAMPIATRMRTTSSFFMELPLLVALSFAGGGERLHRRRSHIREQSTVEVPHWRRR